MNRMKQIEYCSIFLIRLTFTFFVVVVVIARNPFFCLPAQNRPNFQIDTVRVPEFELNIPIHAVR